MNPARSLFGIPYQLKRSTFFLGNFLGFFSSVSCKSSPSRGPWSIIVWAFLADLGSHALAQDPQVVQLPPSVKQDLETTQEKFRMILEEECPQGCFAVGCTASRFITQDKLQNSSLPGLEEDKIQPTPQYKLVSILCEFAYEPKIDSTELNNIKQRVRQRVKNVGVELTIGTRPLTPKVEPDIKGDAPPAEPPPPPPTLGEQLVGKLIPFVPWLLTLVVCTVSILLLIWGWRKLGRTERRSPNARTRASDMVSAQTVDGGDDVEPSPHMLAQRQSQLVQNLSADTHLVAVVLKKYFDEENFSDLIFFVRHFGTDFLDSFKEKPEYREILTDLSEKYAKATTNDSPGQIWSFYDRLERDLVAAKVRIDANPLGDNFLFLASLGVDEFIGILQEVSEEEAIAAVSYAPRKLREQFFASTNPAFTSKFVEHLTRVEKMSDSFVRSVAQKLREIHLQKGESLRVVRRDTVPLFEEALNALDPDKRRKLLLDLKKANPDFLKAVAPAVFLDDLIPLLSNHMLEEALMLVTPDEAAHYLVGYPWAQDILNRINPRLAEAIRRKTPNTPGESDLATQGREKIAQFIKKQHLKGHINLSILNAQLIHEENKKT